MLLPLVFFSFFMLIITSPVLAGDWTNVENWVNELNVEPKTWTNVENWINKFNPVGIEFENATDAPYGIGTEVTWLHTITENNTILFVGTVSLETPVSHVENVTYGGENLTFIFRAQDIDPKTSTEVWYILNPPIGTDNITVTFVSSTNYIVQGLSYPNVSEIDDSSGSGTLGGAGAKTITASVDVSENGGWVVAFAGFWQPYNDYSISSSGVIRKHTWGVANKRSLTSADKGEALTAGSHSISFTTTSPNRASMVIVSFLELPPEVEWNNVENWVNELNTFEREWEDVETWINYFSTAEEWVNVEKWINRFGQAVPIVPPIDIISLIIIPFIFIFAPALILLEEHGFAGLVLGMVIGIIITAIALDISIGLVILLLIAVGILFWKGRE